MITLTKVMSGCDGFRQECFFSSTGISWGSHPICHLSLMGTVLHSCKTRHYQKIRYSLQFSRQHPHLFSACLREYIPLLPRPSDPDFLHLGNYYKVTTFYYYDWVSWSCQHWTFHIRWWMTFSLLPNPTLWSSRHRDLQGWWCGTHSELLCAFFQAENLTLLSTYEDEFRGKCTNTVGKPYI